MDIERLVARPIFEFSSVELAAHVTHCFEDYIAPFKLEGVQFDTRFRPEDLDTKASSIWMHDNDVTAVTLIARRGWTCRLAAMAVAKNFRSLGVGKTVMERVVQEARERGDRRMVLEVIEQNPPAIGLYQRVGFQKTRRLAGYFRPYRPGRPTDLVEIDPLAMNRIMVLECDLDVPWDLVPETLSAKSPPTRAWSLDDQAFALMTDTPSDRAVLWAIFTREAARHQGYGRRLIEGLGELVQGKSIVTPVAVPDGLAPGFFSVTGFDESQLSQFEMSIDLLGRK